MLIYNNCIAQNAGAKKVAFYIEKLTPTVIICGNEAASRNTHEYIDYHFLTQSQVDSLTSIPNNLFKIFVFKKVSNWLPTDTTILVSGSNECKAFLRMIGKTVLLEKDKTNGYKCQYVAKPNKPVFINKPRVNGKFIIDGEMIRNEDIKKPLTDTVIKYYTPATYGSRRFAMMLDGTCKPNFRKPQATKYYTQTQYDSIIKENQKFKALPLKQFTNTIKN